MASIAAILNLNANQNSSPTVHPICFVLIFDSASPSSFCCPINNHCYIRYDVMLGIYPGSFPGLQTSKSTEIEKHVRKRTSEQSRSRKKKRKREPYLQPFKQQALNHYSNSKLAFAKKNKFLILLKKRFSLQTERVEAISEIHLKRFVKIGMDCIPVRNAPRPAQKKGWIDVNQRSF